MNRRGSPDSPPAPRADRVAAAFAATDRRLFLPRMLWFYATQDRPLSIGHGQTNSQPSTVAAMLRLLDVPAGSRVLDVGSGSGWTTALLAVLVGPGGQVTGVEREPELAAWGAANLARWATRVTVPIGSASIETANRSVLGHPITGGYDRILVSASADDVPGALVEQLADPGRMVMPVRHTMVVVDRTGSHVELSEHGAYTFVPLIEGS